MGEEFKYRQDEGRKEVEELDMRDMMHGRLTPDQGTPKVIKRKYESSEKSGNDPEKTPKNQAIKLAGSPYDAESPSSTVRSRKMKQSRLADKDLSPVRHIQGVIGEGIMSNNRNKHDNIIGEGLASSMNGCDDFSPAADFSNNPVKSLNFNDDDTDYQMASSCPIPAPVTSITAYGTDGQPLDD